MIDAQGDTVFDADRAADTTATGHRVCRVNLSSRYDKQHEYDTMIKVVRSLPLVVVHRLKSMWCDSKACATYSVEGERLSQSDLHAIGKAFTAIDGGHNGIYGPGELYVDPDWDEPL